MVLAILVNPIPSKTNKCRSPATVATHLLRMRTTQSAPKISAPISGLLSQAATFLVRLVTPLNKFQPKFSVSVWIRKPQEIADYPQ